MKKFIEIVDVYSQSIIINVDRIIRIDPRDSDLDIDAKLYYDDYNGVNYFDLANDQYLRLISFLEVDYE